MEDLENKIEKILKKHGFDLVQVVRESKRNGKTEVRILNMRDKTEVYDLTTEFDNVSEAIKETNRKHSKMLKMLASEGEKITYKDLAETQINLEVIDGMPCGSEEERDRALLLLIKSAGMKRLVDLLDNDTKETLRQLLKG